jgi:hypothetical protein
MKARVIAELLVWGMRGGLAWLVARESISFVSEKLNAVARALGAV